MMKRIKRLLILLVAVIAAMTLFACGKKQTPAHTAGPAETLKQTEAAAENRTETAAEGKAEKPTETEAHTEAEKPTETEKLTKTETPTETESPTESTPSPHPRIDENGSYYDVENVVLYLHTYGRLPGNYITKKEAKALGWEGGSVEQVAPDKAIGGDHYGNYEGKLPEAAGREYRECDIDTHGYKNRGSRRLIYSSDGLYFYTRDHYENFNELYVTKEGNVEWK